MKKLLVLLVCIFALSLITSCVVVHKKPRPHKKVILKTQGGDYVIIKKVGGKKNIRTWRHHHRKGKKPFRVIHPGMKVKVLKFQAGSALIVLPNGDTVWVDEVYVR